DPHVRSVVTTAIDAGRYICELDPARAAARDAALRARARGGAPSTAADLIPPLRVGAVAVGTPAAGERFVQPWIEADGRRVLLDDATGQGWRLFVCGAALAAQARAAQARAAVAALAPLDVAIVDVTTIADDGTLARWFAERGVGAALVRPDAYVFGTAGDDLDALTTAARGALALRPPHVAIRQEHTE
ncbi:MAG TPA: hypothetical protein VGD56_14810, partial [Gemmatirosa sp.]